jgi:hypothetical protein
MEYPYMGKKMSVTFYYCCINGDPPLQQFVASDVQMDRRTILGPHIMHSVDKERFKTDEVANTIYNAVVNSKETINKKHHIYLKQAPTLILYKVK